MSPLLSIKVPNNLVTFETLFSHVGRFHDPRICQLYSMGLSNKLGMSIYYSHIQAKLGNLGGVILSALCVGITVHPRYIHMKHYLSPYCSFEILLIIERSLEIPTPFTIFLRIKQALFITCNVVSSFLFFKFLPMKKRWWRPMSDPNI